MAPPSRSLNEYHFAKLSTSAPPTSLGGTLLGTGKDSFGLGITPKNLTPYTPAFGALEENVLGENEELDTPTEKKTSSSFSEPSTIFSMLRSSAMSNSSAAPIHLALAADSSDLSPNRGSSVNLNYGSTAPLKASSHSFERHAVVPRDDATADRESGVDDVFQFSLSLEHPNNEESYMHDDDQDAGDTTKYSLAFH